MLEPPNVNHTTITQKSRQQKRTFARGVKWTRTTTGDYTIENEINRVNTAMEEGVTTRVVIRSITASYTKDGVTKDIISKEKTTTGRYKIATPHE